MTKKETVGGAFFVARKEASWKPVLARMEAPKKSSNGAFSIDDANQKLVELQDFTARALSVAAQTKQPVPRCKYEGDQICGMALTVAEKTRGLCAYHASVSNFALSRLKADDVYYGARVIDLELRHRVALKNL